MLPSGEKGTALPPDPYLKQAAKKNRPRRELGIKIRKFKGP